MLKGSIGLCHVLGQSQFLAKPRNMDPPVRTSIKSWL